MGQRGTGRRRRAWGAVLTAAAVMVTCASPATAQTGSQAASAATATTIVPGHTTPPAGGTVSIGEGTDPLGDGAQLGETLGAGVHTVWSAEPSLCPGAGDSEVSTVAVTRAAVIALDRQYQCSVVSAYAITTGAVQWRVKYHFAKSAVVVGGAVYVVHDVADGELYLDDLAATTGTLRWSVPVNADGDAQYTASVGSGVVADDTWIADAATGAQRFTLDLRPGGSTGGTTDVRGGQLLYDSFGAVQAYSVADGHLLWSHAITAYPGPGGGYPALHAGALYYPGGYGTLVLDAASGAQLRLLPPTASDLALDGRIGIFTTGSDQGGVAGTVSARRLSDGHVLWRTALPQVDGRNSGPSDPVIANGLVWFTAGVDTGTPGRLLALDEITGAVRADLPVTCAPLADVAVAQHHVVVATTCGIQTFG